MTDPSERRSLDEMLAITRRRAVALRSTRTRIWAAGAATVALVVLAAAVLVARPGPDGGQQVAVRGPWTMVTRPRTAVTGPERWDPMAPSPLSQRGSPITAWTGDEVLYWHGAGRFSDGCGPGGQDGDYDLICGEPNRNDGAAYDPATNTWRTLPDDPLPDEKGSWPTFVGAWTGAELIVWGGAKGAGAAYDPATDRWRTIAKAPIERRLRGTATWTGSELVIAGGDDTLDRRTGQAPVRSAAAYNPSTDTWRRLPDVPNRAGEYFQIRSAFVGGQVVLLGTGGGTYDAPVAARLLALDPRRGDWAALPEGPIPLPGTFVAVGEQLVVAGSGTDGDRSPLVASYDASTRTWSGLPAVPGGPSFSMVATAKEVIALPSSERAPNDPATLTLVALDLERRSWRTLPPTGLTYRGPEMTWTGEELVVWGGVVGYGLSSDVFGDGALYRPGDRYRAP